MAKSEDNPFVSMTVDQVTDAESRLFFIQVGEEVVEYNGKQTFVKQKAEYLYEELFNSLGHMYENGSDEESYSALLGLLNFRIIPLRIH